MGADEFWIRTLEDVKVGEELTISYVDIYLTREERMGKLQLQYEFYCKCEKCERIPANSTLNRIDSDLDGFLCPSEGCKGSYSWKYSKIDFHLIGLQCYKCNKQEEGEKILQHYELIQRKVIEGLNQLSLHLDKPKEEFNGEFETLKTLMTFHLFPYNSYLFRLKMAHARHNKMLCQHAIDEYSIKAHEDLITALTEVNKMCLIIYPRYHPQRAHILLDLSITSTALNRPALGRKFANQAKKILLICRGEEMWKRIVS